VGPSFEKKGVSAGGGGGSKGKPGLRGKNPDVSGGSAHGWVRGGAKNRRRVYLGERQQLIGGIQVTKNKPLGDGHLGKRVELWGRERLGVRKNPLGKGGNHKEG